MSKNIKLNGKDYNGISTVQLPTASGGTASFMDAEDVVMPDGTVEIKTNGMIDIRNFAMANVNVPTEGGSSFETGTFVGDDTYKVTLPVTSKKRGYAIMVNDYENIIANELETTKEHGIFWEIFDGTVGAGANVRRYVNEKTGWAGFLAEGPLAGIKFKDNAIEKTYCQYVTLEHYISGKTYTWIAW